MSPIAGVDGCRGGWICVSRPEPGRHLVAVHPTFAGLVDSLAADTVIAVDMPIGLPERTGPGGRGPEAAVRPLLGARQSSVFSIPPRAAVYAGKAPFRDLDSWYEAHRQASTIARGLSDPPRGVSIQAFGIFPRICELDCFLLAYPDARHRIFESHPELAFRTLAGGRPMALPKKIRSRVNPEGMAERRAVLAGAGLPAGMLHASPPPGAGADDLLDATAMLLVAERLAAGSARPYPDPPLTDDRGLICAIWT